MTEVVDMDSKYLKSFCNFCLRHCLFLVLLILTRAQCFLRGRMRENLIFSPCLFLFPQHKSRYSWSFICYKEENDQEKQNKHEKSAVWKGVRDEEREKESKRRQNSSENKALSWEGWKALDADAYLRKNDLWKLPHSPKCLFFSFISLSLSHFTLGSRASNLFEISLSRFIYSLPDCP